MTSSSENMTINPQPPPRNPNLIFQDENIRFTCSAPTQQQQHRHRIPGDPGPKTTRELTGFIGTHYYQPQRQPTEFRPNNIYPESVPSRNWAANGRASTSADGSEDDDVDDDDEDDDDGVDNEVEELGGVNNNNNNNNNNSGNNGSSNNSGRSSATADTIGLKEGNVGQCGNDSNNNNNKDVRGSLNRNPQEGKVGQYPNVVTIADPDGDLYYSQYLSGQEGLNAGQKDMVVENGYGIGGRSESGESLRGILSDPLTGALMDDAMILPCGHSFGGAGIQHVIRMKACSTCSQVVSEESVAPNLSLRAAVQAFRREEELQVNRTSKKRRERYEQDNGSYGDSMLMDHPRGRGVQFPFVVTDRVIIKGNKRTPQRFVGREAVVTTQCLNGWYVVKTLDNAESVKLQYRSLAKVSG